MFLLNRILHRMVVAFVLLAFLAGDLSAQEEILARDKLQFYARRISGRALLKRDPHYKRLLEMVENGQDAEVVREFITWPSFSETTGFRFASRILSPEEQVDLQLNDAIATILGTIRDDLPAQGLVTGDYLYAPDRRFDQRRPSRANNNVYIRLANSSRSVARLLTKIEPQWRFMKDYQPAGIMTSRGWGEIYYADGTNRKAFKAAMRAFMCAEPEVWKQRGLPEFRIRQDIDRSPGEDVREFKNECRSCHSPMDALGGAFAHLDFIEGEFVYTASVRPKMYRNANVYPEGYRTFDDSWINLLTNTRSKRQFGFNGKQSGQGLGEFADFIARSSGFERCMVRRTYQEVCHKEIGMTESLTKRLARKFKTANFGMKELFVLVVTDPSCIAD